MPFTSLTKFLASKISAFYKDFVAGLDINRRRRLVHHQSPASRVTVASVSREPRAYGISALMIARA